MHGYMLLGKWINYKPGSINWGALWLLYSVLDMDSILLCMRMGISHVMICRK